MNNKNKDHLSLHLGSASPSVPRPNQPLSTCRPHQHGSSRKPPPAPASLGLTYVLYPVAPRDCSGIALCMPDCNCLFNSCPP